MTTRVVSVKGDYHGLSSEAPCSYYRKTISVTTSCFQCDAHISCRKGQNHYDTYQITNVFTTRMSIRWTSLINNQLLEPTPDYISYYRLTEQ